MSIDLSTTAIRHGPCDYLKSIIGTKAFLTIRTIFDFLWHDDQPTSNRTIESLINDYFCSFTSTPVYLLTVYSAAHKKVSSCLQASYFSCNHFKQLKSMRFLNFFQKLYKSSPTPFMWLKLLKNYKGTKMISHLLMLRSKQPLTEHKVDLVFFKYIENDLWFINHIHDYFKELQKLYKSRTSRSLWFDLFWNDISFKLTSHVIYKVKYHNFLLFFPRQFWYVLLQIYVTPKQKSGIGLKLTKIKNPLIISLMNCFYYS